MNTLPKYLQSITGQLLICDRDGQAKLHAGTVSIEDDLISEIQLGGISAEADFGNRETLICPGFIDTHLHLPQFDSIGGHGRPLLQWLDEVIFPSEIQWENVGWAAAMTDRVIHQCFAVGTTGICAYATVHHESTMLSLKRASEVGLRGVIGQVLMDRFAPDPLCRDSKQLIDEVNKTIEAFPPSARMAAAVTPRFAITCSERLLQAAGQIADQSGAVVQTHLAETIAECRRVEELFSGKSYTAVYDESALLSERSILGHAIHLNDEDYQRLASRGAGVAHCPTANRFLMSGTMNRARHLHHGVKVMLGSDIGAGYERSMVRVARAMIEAAAEIACLHDSNDGNRQDNAAIPSASQGWYQITAGNADALGWTGAGRLEIGASADLVVIQPDLAWLSGPVDPLSRLMFSWDDRWVAATLVQGRVRYLSARSSK